MRKYRKYIYGLGRIAKITVDSRGIIGWERVNENSDVLQAYLTFLWDNSLEWKEAEQ